MTTDNNSPEERVQELEDALLAFSLACDYATKMTEKAALETMDARDFFMWQTSRRLCVKDFINARRVLKK